MALYAADVSTNSTAHIMSLPPYILETQCECRMSVCEVMRGERCRKAGKNGIYMDLSWPLNERERQVVQGLLDYCWSLAGLLFHLHRHKQGADDSQLNTATRWNEHVITSTPTLQDKYILQIKNIETNIYNNAQQTTSICQLDTTWILLLLARNQFQISFLRN